MFIKDSICISPQATFPSRFLETDLREHLGNKYLALEPSYEGLIQPGALRRMGKAVKMGVAAGMQLLRNARQVDGIIIGTANGGLEDCIKFLNQIVDYDEGTLTPTNFVQSTPNAIAGQLALMHDNSGYNITHAHGGLSFENALIDAALLFEQLEANSLLVGSIEEISDYNHNIDQLSGFFKEEVTSSLSLLSSTTKGSINGEGSAMFLLEREQSAEKQSRILDTAHVSFASPDTVYRYFENLLQRNKLECNQIDGLILGYNGDIASAGWYDNLRKYFSDETTIFSFKNACGEYPTASSFALWLGQQILENNPIPDQLIIGGNRSKNIGRLIIYNHYHGNQHSFFILDTPNR